MLLHSDARNVAVCPVALCGDSETLHLVNAFTLSPLAAVDASATPSTSRSEPQQQANRPLSVADRIRLRRQQAPAMNARRTHHLAPPVTTTFQCLDGLVDETDGAEYYEDPDLYHNEYFHPSSRVVIGTNQGSACIVLIPPFRTRLGHSTDDDGISDSSLTPTSSRDVLRLRGHVSPLPINGHVPRVLSHLRVIQQRVEKDDAKRKREGKRQSLIRQRGAFAFIRQSPSRASFLSNSTTRATKQPQRLRIKSLADHCADSSAFADRIVTAGEDSTAQIWDSSDGTRIGYFQNVVHNVTAMLSVPQWGEFFLAQNNGPIRMFNLEEDGWSGDVWSVSRFLPRSEIHAMEANVNRNLLYAGGSSRSLLIFDRKRPGRSIRTVGLNGFITSMCIALDRNWLLVGFDNGAVGCYHVEKNYSQLWSVGIQNLTQRCRKILRVDTNRFVALIGDSHLFGIPCFGSNGEEHEERGEVDPEKEESCLDSAIPTPDSLLTCQFPFRINDICLLRQNVERRQQFLKFELEELEERLAFLVREEEVVDGTGVLALDGIVTCWNASDLRFSRAFVYV